MKRLLLLMSLALASVISSHGQQTQQRASSDSNSSVSEQPDLVQVIKQCVDSVVLIEVRDTSDKVMRTGSGFVASPDGRIVTNYHVIKDAPSAYIKLNNGAFFKVDGLVASDADADVAIIKVAGNNLPVLVFGDSDKASVGETVIAIGSPLGLANSVSTGIISGLRDDSGRKWIQTTAAISPGNSGGPLTNSGGQVLGMVTMKVVGGENLNFAIPANTVKNLLAFAGSEVKPLDATSHDFKFAPGQKVYVVTSPVSVERKANDQFMKDRQFKVNNGLRGADFVFMVLLDESVYPEEELALVVLPADFSQYRTDLIALQDHALWRGGGPLHAFTSESKSLVRKFEQAVLPLSQDKQNR